MSGLRPLREFATDEYPPKTQYVDVTYSHEHDDAAHARVRDKHDAVIDEPPWVPIGNDTAPCPVDYLVLAAAGCQVEVLRQALEKARIEEFSIHAHAVRGRRTVEPPPEPMPEYIRSRVGSIDLHLTVETTAEFEARARRCLEVADQACIVSRSIEEGLDVPLSKELTVRTVDG
ncbi:MAG: OsmC family protein [Halobacteriales archaeon]|nr:OsmC family protein [Halobacteriales archaeon]